MIGKEMLEPRIFHDKDGYFLPYRFLCPDLKPKTTYPLVLFLHGAGERGTDNISQLAIGIMDFVNNPSRLPCFIVAPQCPPEIKWVDTDWAADSHFMPTHPAAPLQSAMHLLDLFTEEYPVDRSRMYCTGLSMGAFGTWDLLMRKPDLFAAAVAVCGGADITRANTIQHIPQWVTHGALDRTVKVKRSRDMVNALRGAGADPVYKEFPTVDHNAWDYSFNDQEMAAWLFNHRKGS